MMHISYFKFLCFPIFVFFISHTLLTARGVDISGGGKILSHQYNPWFIGNKPITYCIQKSVDFSQDLEGATYDVARAFDDWHKTITALDNFETSEPLLDGKQKVIASQFVLKESCSDDVDLTILLGVINEEIISVLEDNLMQYIGFTNRTHFDQESGWSKGYIWITPDLGPFGYQGLAKHFWDKGGLFEVMLHEIGHVLGFHHQFNHIMNKNFPSNIVQRLISIGEGEIPHTDLNYYSSKSLILDEFMSYTERYCDHSSQIKTNSNLKPFFMDLLGEKFASFGEAVMNGIEICINNVSPSSFMGIYITVSIIKLGHPLLNEEPEVLGEGVIKLEDKDITRRKIVQKSVSGRYKKSDGDFFDHDFISYHETVAFGTFSMGGKVFPVRVQGRDSVQITFIYENQFAEMTIFPSLGKVLTLAL